MNASHAHLGSKGGLAGVFEVLPSPALLVNLRSQVTEVNSAALQFLGHKSKDLVQKDVLEALISEEDRAEAGVYVKEALDGAAGDKSLKVTCIGRTGRKQVCLRAATTRSGGKLDGAIITLQDMSEIRNLAGATNTGGAEHLSGALHAVGTALFALDTEGKILEWTPKMEKMTGFSSGQASGQEMGKFVAEAFQSAMKKSVEQALRGQEVSRFTVEINSAGNRPKEAWMSMAPWRSATGRIVGVMGHFDDVIESDRRVMEADWLREACAEQLDQANAFVLSVDSNMCVTEWNHRLADVTGKDKEAVAGKKLLDLVLGSKQLVTDSVKAALSGAWSAPVQITVASLEMMVGFSPQLNFSGKVIGALAIGQPAAGSVAPTKASVGSDVKGMVLHELRSPLHGIIGLANTLSQDDGQLKKPLTMIGVSAQRALELATNIVDFWKYQAEAVRQGPKDDMVDLGALAREVVSKSKGLQDKGGRPLKKDKVNLHTEIQTVAVAADSSAMQQLLNQLLINALKFTADGEVSLSVKEVDKSAVITVRDTGSGIKPKILEGVLQAFSPGSDSREEVKGIGLGLSLVKEVVRIHSGRCEIQPQEKGTLVTVTIPCQPPTKMEKTPAPATGNVSWKKVPSTKQKGPPSSWLGPMAQLGIQMVTGNAAANPGSRTATSLPSLKEGITTDQPSSAWEEEDNLIMSVDDYVNQEVMRSILEPCGFKVIACMNGTECLEYLDGDNPRPRLLLLDLMMPGLSGFDVLQALHKKVSLMELPVVMVSAKNQSSSVVKGYELGCRDWIHKPFCRQELIARVKSHLKMRAMLLNYRLSAAQVRSQENLPAVEEDESGGKSPMNKEVLQVDVSQSHVDGPCDTTALFATVDSEVAIENMASVFEAFESLSEQYQAFRTEIIGNSYLAIAVGTGDETRHTDKLLLLAHKLRDTARKASMSLRVGIDTDTSVPAKPLGKRQYPKSSFFSATLQKARQLSEAAAEHRILLSRSARCRLSADVEAELQQSGLRLLSGDASSHLGEHYFIAETTESDPKPLRAPAKPEAPEATPQPAEKMLLESQMAVQALHQELLKSQNGFSVLQKQLSMAEEQMLQAKSEAGSLRTQLQVAKAAAAAPDTSGPRTEMPKEKVPEISSSPQSTSLLFLQWQNAHLQAEIRHYQSALSSTKMELQMQIMAGQLLESKHSLLQARVEHLELDLGFKVACGSAQHLASEPAHSRPDSLAQPAATEVEAPPISSLASMGCGLTVPTVPGLIGPGVSNLPNLMPTLQQLPFSQMPGMSGVNIGGISGLQPGMSGISGLGGAGMAGAAFGTGPI